MQERKALMVEMRLTGRSYQQIGDTFNITRQRVQQLIKPPKATRLLIWQRANGLCELCGKSVEEIKADIHHKGNTEDYNDILNLQLLCVSCHLRQHPQSLPATVQYISPIECKCLNCGTLMHRAGFGWSGKKRVQRFRCQKCGNVVQRSNY